VVPKSVVDINASLTSQLRFNVWRPARWANWIFEAQHLTENQTHRSYRFTHGGFQGARGHLQGGDWFVEGSGSLLDSPGANLRQLCLVLSGVPER